jgi:hypothetical protein
MFTRSYRKAKTDNGSEYLKRGRKSNFTHIVEDLLSKSSAYMLYYNILRPNMGNRWKTPKEMLEEEFPDLSPLTTLSKR